MKEAWKQACTSPNPVVKVGHLDDLTLDTASMSADTNPIGRALEGVISFGEEEIDLDYCDDSPEFSAAENPQSADKEGDGTFHAMVLLGSRRVGDEGFWLIQNSWGGKGMPILEMSCDFLADSGAEIAFLGHAARTLRDTPASLFQCFPSPVAESGFPSVVTVDLGTTDS